MNASIPSACPSMMKPDESKAKVMDNGSGMENNRPPRPTSIAKMAGEEEARGMGMFSSRLSWIEVDGLRTGTEEELRSARSSG